MPHFNQTSVQLDLSIESIAQSGLSVKPGMAGMDRNEQEWIGMDRNEQE